MILIQLSKFTFALAVLGFVCGAQRPNPKPGRQAPAASAVPGQVASAVPGQAASAASAVPGQTESAAPDQFAPPATNPTLLDSVDPNDPKANVDAPTGFAMQIMDTIGLTSRARKPVAPIYVPRDLTGKSDEEIMNLIQLLMVQRRKIQKRMTRHMAYTAVLMVILHFFGSSNIIKGGAAGLFWLNNNFRATINADWMVHQQQLADFIVEYRRVKKLQKKTFPKSFWAGVPIISMDYADGHSVSFPIWTTVPGQRLPKEAEVRKTVPLIRNWAVRK